MGRSTKSDSTISSPTGTRCEFATHQPLPGPVNTTEIANTRLLEKRGSIHHAFLKVPSIVRHLPSCETISDGKKTRFS